MRHRGRVPGCIFINNGRYWWRIRLPGEKAKKARPLVPAGGQFATDDRGAAEEIARNTYAQAVFRSGGNGNGDGRKPKKDHFDGTVAAVVRKYMDHCRGYYLKPDGRPTGEAEKIELALRYLIQHCPSLPAEQFGPLMLKAVRQEMIEADLCRAQINKRVGQIKRMFRWAVEEQLVPPSIWHGLQAVMGLKRGRSGARESEPVKPVPEAWVRKTMEFLPPTVAAMVELQMLTGMRPGEVCILRPCDIDMTGKIWLYRPAEHKTAIHGHQRVVPIGPRGQEVLRPFLGRSLDAYCFAPDEAQRQRFAVKRANPRPACSRRSRTAGMRTPHALPATATTRAATATPCGTPSRPPTRPSCSRPRRKAARPRKCNRFPTGTRTSCGTPPRRSSAARWASTPPGRSWATAPLASPTPTPNSTRRWPSRRRRSWADLWVGAAWLQERRVSRTRRQLVRNTYTLA